MTLKIDRPALSVRHLMHPDKTRYAMNGICLGPKGVVTTNGKALAWVRFDSDSEHRVLNIETVKALHKGIKTNGYAEIGEATYELVTPALPARGRRKEAVPETRTTGAVKLQDGLFPPWEDVINQSGTYLALEPVEISQLEQIADVFSQFGEGTACRIGYTATEIVDTFARAPERGELHWNAPNHGMKAHEIGIDPNLLGDVCKVLREFHKGENVDTVSIQLPETKGGNAAKRAAIFESKRKDGRTLFVLLMPLNL